MVSLVQQMELNQEVIGVGDFIVLKRNEQRLYTWAMDVIYDKITLKEFSTLSGLSYRHCQRFIKRIEKKGMLALVHGNHGKKPWNRISDDLKLQVVSLLETKYPDFNLTHFREKLIEDHGLKVNRESLRRWAKEKNLVKRPKRRKRKAHKPRPRMPRAGMLVQFDGSEFAWLGKNKPIYTMIGGIDDATGEILYLELFAAEDTFNCLKSMKEIVRVYGVPEAFYVDRAGHFGKPYAKQERTQVGRALAELDCKAIFASSPQAKGRIERLWNTLQDRLVAELRHQGIQTVRQANNFIIKKFIPSFNEQFGVPPREAQSAFKPIEPYIRLGRIFCIKEKRRISTGNVFSFAGIKYVVHSERDLRFRFIDILLFENGDIEFDLLGAKVSVYKVGEASAEEESDSEAA